ncbi:MAG: Crp/Fnr family transcriptional regulator [Polyangiaceae bacterium]
MKTDPSPPRIGRDFRAGEVLFREGDEGREMFVIQDGKVQVSKRVGETDRPIAVLGRGEFLGEMAILNNKLRSATATVIDDATCLVIDGQTLEAMIAGNSEIAIRLIKKLAARLDAADALVDILMHPDPRARVMLALVRHAETFGEHGDDGIRLNVTAGGLAREVGVNIEMVLTVLTRLEKLGIAVQDDADGAVVITDAGRLLEFLELLEMPRKFEAAS